MQVHLHVFKTTRMFPSEPKSLSNMNIDMRHVLVLSAHACFLQRNRYRFTKDNIIKKLPDLVTERHARSKCHIQRYAKISAVLVQHAVQAVQSQTSMKLLLDTGI